MYLDTIMDTSISSTNAHRVPSLSYQPLVFDATLDTTNMHNVLLIDSTVPDFQQYANADTFAIIYDRTSSKEQLLEIVKSKFQNISRIAVVCHFEEQPHFLNNELLFSDTNTQFIVDIIKQFNVSHVDYLACNTLQSQEWTDYYTKIHSATGITIGASNDNTGNLKYGGDWIMESTHEDIQTIYFNELIKNYSSLLEYINFSVDSIIYQIFSLTANVGVQTNKQLVSINIASSVTYNNKSYNVITITSGAFINCTFLTSVIIPTTVTSIGNNAFQYCFSLTSVIIPTTVTSIGNNAFQYCTSLRSVTIPTLVTSISNNMFDGCTSLTSVIIPTLVTSIGTNAFTDCKISSIDLPNNLQIINTGAFLRCTNLTSILIPSLITTIVTQTFYGCQNLTSVYFKSTIPKIDSSNNFPQNTKAYYITGVNISNLSVFTTKEPYSITRITSVTPLTGSAIVCFTATEVVSLFVVENYYYSLDGSSTYVKCTPNIITSFPNTKSYQTKIPNLSMNRQYTIRIKAQDTSGISSVPSEPFAISCIGIPDAPTNIGVSFNNNVATISFTPGADNGEIKTFLYWIDSVNCIDSGTKVSPIIITNFGYSDIARTINVQGYNSAGSGALGYSGSVYNLPPISYYPLQITDLNASKVQTGTFDFSSTLTVHMTDIIPNISNCTKKYELSKTNSFGSFTPWSNIGIISITSDSNDITKKTIKISISYYTTTIKIRCIQTNSITNVITYTNPSDNWSVTPDRSNVVQGSAVNGYISGGTITILDLYGNEIGGPVTTDSVGGYTLSEDNLPDYYIVSCVGGTNIATNQPLLTELKSVVMNIGEQTITDATVVLSPLTTIVTNLVKGQQAIGVIDISGAILKVATALDIPVNQVNQDYLATSNVQVASASVKIATITGSISSATGLLPEDVMSSISELINNTTGKLLIDQSTVNTIVTTTTTNLGVDTPVPQSVLNTLSTLVVAVSDAINAPGISLATLYKTSVGATTLASGITSSSGDITGQLAGAVSSAVIGTITRPAAIITGNICYRKGTKIVTDQGIIEIENLTKHNSIRGKEVKLISKTTNIDDYLIKIEKGGLYENVPNADTYVTGEHKIFYNREMIRAKKLVNGSTIKREKSLNETMYNVLLEGEYEGKMIANGLIGETLNPKGEMAKLLCYVETLGLKEREEVIEEVNRNMKKEHERRKNV